LTDLLAADLYERLSRRFGESVFLDLDTDATFAQLELHPPGWNDCISLIFLFNDAVFLSVGEHVCMEFDSDDGARNSDDVYTTIVDIAQQGVYAYRFWGMIGTGFGQPRRRARVIQSHAGWEFKDTVEK